ncbi:hypothetical protein [Mycobacterium sp.]|uniref:hypothetical protein n=1 Tax=Mycobacterium sp. TaxID=1785 RepID=UPI003D0E03AE
MNDVVIAGAGLNGLMLAGELGLAGTPDPPQPSPWAMFAAMALNVTKVPSRR